MWFRSVGGSAGKHEVAVSGRLMWKQGPSPLPIGMLDDGGPQVHSCATGRKSPEWHWGDVQGDKREQPAPSRPSGRAAGALMSWRSTTAVMAVALITATTAGGCSGDRKEQSVGSLGTQTEEVGTLCLPMGDEHHFIVGWETLHNSASTPVTVKAVGLTDPQGLTLESARLAPIPPPESPGNLVGLHQGTQPRPGTRGARVMKRSVPALGGEITGGQQMNLVLILSSDGGGRSGPARVRYTDADGGEHLWVGGSRMRIAPGRRCPSGQ